KKEEIVHFESSIKFKELQSIVEKEIEKNLPRVKLPKEWEEYLSVSGYATFLNCQEYQPFYGTLGEAKRNMQLSKPYPRTDYDLEITKTKEIANCLKEFKQLMKEKEDFKSKLTSILNAFTT